MAVKKIYYVSGEIQKKNKIQYYIQNTKQERSFYKSLAYIWWPKTDIFAACCKDFEIMWDIFTCIKSNKVFDKL